MTGTDRRHHWTRRPHVASLTIFCAAASADVLVRHWSVMFLVLFIVEGLAVTGWWTMRHGGHIVSPRLEDPVLGGVGSLGVLVMHDVGHWSVILAACVMGSLGGLGVRWYRGAQDYHGAPICAGAFAAMTNPSLVSHQWLTVVMGVITGLIWSLSREAWIGVGGKIGVTAMASSLLVVALGRHGAAGLNAHMATPTDLIVALVAASAVSASVTWWLSYRRQWQPVLGFAIPSTVVAVVAAFLCARPSHANLITSSWMAAAFVGMSSPVRLRRPIVSVPVTGALCGLLFTQSGARLGGIGGRLGLLALVSVSAVMGAQHLVILLRSLRNAGETAGER